MGDKVHTFWATILLVAIFVKNSSTVAKKLNASQAFDDTWNTASDLENELEQKRGSGTWSGWSEWSTCSRTCDGGIMQQIRRCSNPSGCKGESVRHRICNMQPCPEQQDFRAHQCAAYNDVPYDGTLYRWTPHYDYVEPCALTCRGRPAHLTDDVSMEAEPADDSEHYEEPSVIVQLAARVQDGTRCRSGSLDMCIQGRCQRVGCDLKIGSTKKIDECGVCGGEGSSCTQPLHRWETSAMSLCSVTCGGGYQMSSSVCRNRISGADVDDALCNAATRPEPAVELCNTHTCPPRWFADEWSACSRLCGSGYRERMVVCAEETNGVKTRISETLCRAPKPPTQEPCIVQECPKWEAEEWTSCTVSCGKGVQMRGVECKSADGSLSAKCDPHSKPLGAQQCSTGVGCDGNVGGGTIIIGSSGPRSRQRSAESSTALEEEEDLTDGDIDEVEDDLDADDAAESYSDQVPSTRYAHYMIKPLQHEEPEGPRVQRLTGGGGGTNMYDTSMERPSVEPTFIKNSEWSPCSVTCGEGIRRRPYKCKIFLEYSRTIATVNDTLCEGVKPHDEVERCVEEPCMLPSHGYEDQYPRDSIKVGVSEPGKTYVWREQGYTSCSASCLGGVEELIINCVREDNGRVVSPFLCAPETKPEARVRTCNDRPCPPRWNYSDYTPCSKSCGIGIKTREVQCIHEVTRGGENTMVVPNSMCPQPPPADRQYCNVLDCPVRWEVAEWSKCSHTCGYGIKERKVECKQIMAQEHKIERPEAMCPSAKPPDKKPCNVKPCPPEDPKPVISVSNTTHIQHDPKKAKVTLKVGGAGVVFFGTQVKIKCPVKRFNRTKIKWAKDHKPLTRSRKFKVSKKGALRILDITFRDAGIYSCHAGLSAAEIHIEVKAKPGQQAEELERQESERLVRERSGTEPLTSADMTTNEDGEAENGSQQTTTTRKKQAKANGGRERSRRPKSDGVQHADSSIMEDEHSQLVQQQAQDGLPQPASASSGSSRRASSLLAMPYFQALLSNLQFLWPLQRFSHSRGHDKLLGAENSFRELERFEQDDPASALQLSAEQLASNAESTSNSNITQPIHVSWQTYNNNYGSDVKQSTFEVHYRWKTSEWSECSQKCGSAEGLRQRSVACMRILDPLNMDGENSLLSAGVEDRGNFVDIELCTDQSIAMPDAFETCGSVECAQWQPDTWTPCQQSRCYAQNTAMQRRDISCKYANGSAANDCEQYERPLSRQQCYNERCKGVWRVEPWSACNAACGRQGVKYRILQCVWYGTRRPAGNACKHLTRPAVMKICKSTACLSQSEHHCKDTSRYCRNVRSMGLCRLHRYQEKCCRACKQQSQQQLN